MKYSTLVTGAALMLALSATAYAAENDDLLNTVTASPDITVEDDDYVIDDSIELSLEEEIEKMVGKGAGATHKSEVAKAVADLVDTAKLDGTVGETVRMLAVEQGDIHTAVAEKMDTIEGMDEWSVFLWGPDYKALGELRSALVTSENGLKVLRTAQGKAHATLQDDIEVQIQALEHENEHAREFIAEHEDVFSLFGWFFKLF